MCELCEAKKISVMQAILMVKDLVREHNLSVEPKYAVHTAIILHENEGIVTGCKEFIDIASDSLNRMKVIANSGNNIGGLQH